MRKIKSIKKVPYHIYWASKGKYGEERLERFKKRLDKRIEALKYNCPRCHKQRRSEYPHTCPYEEDINGDYQTKCYCCAYCEDACAGDI